MGVRAYADVPADHRGQSEPVGQHGDSLETATAGAAGVRASLRRDGARPAPLVEPAAAQAQAADPVDRLERLAALKDRGLITDEEFAQQKRRILGES
ncbi:MAG: SHOCT domain-containing protein [Mycobacterium sp.]|nr:MAG: SHOCT domain-containing protein [Mycobacterium sp.]